MDNGEFQKLVLQQFQNIAGEFKALNQNIAELRAGQEELQADITNLKAGQQDLQADITNLKAGQQDLQADIANLKAGQKDLQADITDLKAGQNGVQAEVAELRNSQKSILADLAVLKNGQLKLESRLENEVVDKIRALFDSRQVHEDKFKRVINKLESVQIDTGYLVARVARLEELAR